MNLCKTCKYYVKFDDPPDVNAGCCEHELVQDFESAGDITPINGVRACSETGDEYGYLYVGPNFGCIHHEPRKKRKKS